MSTTAQLTANSLNAQKSTGPRTVAGKAIAAGNALKTGLYAGSHVITGESADEYSALTAEYYAEHHPTTPSQCALVGTLIHNEWLLRRLRRVESDLWNQGIRFLQEDRYQPKDHLLANTFANTDERFERLQRRINSLDRAWHRALKALAQLQAVQARAQSAPDSEPELIGPQLVSPQIGFVPSPEISGSHADAKSGRSGLPTALQPVLHSPHPRTPAPDTPVLRCVSEQ